MAKKIDSVRVELEATDKSVAATLQNTGKKVKDFVKTANKDLGGFGASTEERGSFGDMALFAKKLKREKRTSGESALGKVLGSGGNAADFALDALGMGMQGMVVDQIGKVFSKAAALTVELAEGKKTVTEIGQEWTRSLPIVGEFVQGWDSVFKIMSGEAAAQREINLMLKEQASWEGIINEQRKARTAMRDATLTDPLTKRLGTIKAKRIADLAGNEKDREASRVKEADVLKSMNWGETIHYHTNSVASGITGSTRGQAEAMQVYKEAEARYLTLHPEKDKAKALAQVDSQFNSAARIERERAIKEEGLSLDAAIAQSNLGTAEKLGGNPFALLSMHKAAARASSAKKVNGIDENLSDIAEQLKVKRDPHDPEGARLLERQGKLQQLRAQTVTEGEAEITHLEVEEAKRTEASLWNIEKEIEAGRLSILVDTAKSGDEILTAQQQQITQKYEGMRAEIDAKLKAPGIGDTERSKLSDRRGQLGREEAAAQGRLTEDEGKKRQDSLLSIDREIAAGRLSVQRAGAKDATAIWGVMEAELNQRINAQLAEIDKKINDRTTTAAERAKLIEERGGAVAAGEAEKGRAKENYDKQVNRDRSGVAGGILGMSSHMLGNLQGQFGGNSPQAIKMQKFLGIMSDSLSTKGHLQGILDDKQATEGQKKAAREMMAENDAHTAFAASDKQLNRGTYNPLRLADAQVGGSRFGGAAALAKEQDAAAYGNRDDVKEHTKETAKYMKLLYDILNKAAKEPGNPMGELFAPG